MKRWKSTLQAIWKEDGKLEHMNSSKKLQKLNNLKIRKQKSLYRNITKKEMKQKKEKGKKNKNMNISNRS